MRFEISLLALIAAVAYAAPAPIPEAKPADVDNAVVDSAEVDNKYGGPTFYYVQPPPQDKSPKLVFNPKTGKLVWVSSSDQSKKSYPWKREAEPMPAPEAEAEPMPAPEAEAEAVAVAPDNVAPNNGYYGQPIFIPVGQPQPQVFPQFFSSSNVRSSGNTLTGLANFNDVLNGNTLDVDLLK